MSFYSWKPYVSVAKRRQQAARKLIKMQKKGQAVSPVLIEGRTIASSFWGKSWCSNLERYSDYANRLPRGRTYVRNGSVLDLKIARGQVAAMVSGSELYTIRIAIAPVTGSRWTAICKDCSGSIDSLVELLQGRLDKSVMDRVCRQGDGLFPAPGEIELSCSCPDWADMCKHVAAALYGVGARLDERPELLFVLRGVDEKDLIAGAGAGLPLRRSRAPMSKVLADGDMAALFGLDMVESGAEAGPEPGSAKSAPAARSLWPRVATGSTSKATARTSSRSGSMGPTRKRAASRARRGKVRARKQSRAS
jgi:uncharacterized Zn finger protein